jgi:hypothetical protein
MIGSSELHLRAEKKSPKTIRTYLEAAQWFAAEYLTPAGLDDWSDVKAARGQPLVQAGRACVWQCDVLATRDGHWLPATASGM